MTNLRWLVNVVLLSGALAFAGAGCGDDAEEPSGTEETAGGEEHEGDMGGEEGHEGEGEGEDGGEQQAQQGQAVAPAQAVAAPAVLAQEAGVQERQERYNAAVVAISQMSSEERLQWLQELAVMLRTRGLMTPAMSRTMRW